MKIFRFSVLITGILALVVFLSSEEAFAQRKAKVVSPATDVYEEADFDSSVIRTVDPNEVFLVSKKLYGPFYKVKFKDGTLGFIADTELDIEGVGPFKPKPYVEDVLAQKNSKNKNESAMPKLSPEEEDEDIEESKLVYKGVSFQMINFHEDTMGGVQVADMMAYGFRYQPMSSQYDSALAYEVIVAPQAPDYYAEKTGASASGAIVWATAQISNITGLNNKTSIRYGAGPFMRLSHFNVQKNAQRYSLQDLTAGLDIQAGIMLHSRYLNVDLGVRYFWDKESYGAVGVAFLF